MNEDDEIEWIDYEYSHRPKTVDWYWGLGLYAFAGFAISIFFGNLLFGILILVGALAMGLFSVREPKEIDYILGDKGITIGDLNYSYHDFQSFFVEEQKHADKLILMTKKFFMPELVLTINDYEPEYVREFMLKKLPEVPHHEPFIHAIADRIGI